MNIYTAHYRYSGPDRMDITVKGNIPPGNVLAPEWGMVRGLQAGTLNQWDYTVKYFALLMARMRTAAESKDTRFEEIFNLPRESITLVCFCKPQTFCHRTIAAQLIQEMGYGRYIGERQI